MAIIHQYIYIFLNCSFHTSLPVGWGSSGCSLKSSTKRLWVSYILQGVNSFLLLGSPLLYEYTRVCLTIHLLLDMWTVPNFYQKKKKLLWTFVYESLNICFQVAANLRSFQVSVTRKYYFHLEDWKYFKNCEFWWGHVGVKSTLLHEQNGTMDWYKSFQGQIDSTY